MALNECIPYYENGQNITGQAEESVTGKTFAEVSGSRPYGPGFSLTSTDSGGGNIPVRTAAAGGLKFGVFANDQPTAGGKVNVICGVGFVVPVTAGAAIGANQEVSVGAGGKAVPRAVTAGVQATGVLGKVASNNAVLITAIAKDSSGNTIKIKIEPLTATKAFAITNVGNEFKVTLKTSAGSVSETKASELIAELNANAAFKAVAVASNFSTSTGAGLAEAGETQLSGGLDEGLARAAGLCVSAANENEDAQIKLY